MKTAILISGRGSNMRALVDAAREPDFPASIELVLSNRADAAGLTYAADAGIATAVLPHRDYESREAFEAALDTTLREAGIELICLAGFMRLLSDEFVEGWRNRVINIHPSLLPAFRGLRTHERALATGVRVHGATVHYVRAEMDDGPIIVQGAVPVLADDTSESLAVRVLAAEHRIYPLALSWVAGRKARVVAEKVILEGLPTSEDAVLIVPSGEQQD
ncbi:phosphoribosylglycinamide formyltransferase-1 [Rhodopseudomonas julia]|uniref:Phosphoribosylglycinamide formyltransferase n=1 Tax=Rhodopseudomonas julia TaxID=200617 RepID=A0ABU0C9K2_9BRAD|nr:phosphoribosylglycinamide formyltransferase-1 [Rhodopseudomonas julia]